MRKTIAAVTVGIMLIAGQSLVQAQAAAPIVDRIAVQKDDKDDIVVPLAILGLAAAIVLAASSGGNGQPASA